MSFFSRNTTGKWLNYLGKKTRCSSSRLGTQPFLHRHGNTRAGKAHSDYDKRSGPLRRSSGNKASSVNEWGLGDCKTITYRYYGLTHLSRDKITDVFMRFPKLKIVIFSFKLHRRLFLWTRLTLQWIINSAGHWANDDLAHPDTDVILFHVSMVALAPCVTSRWL